MKLFRTSNLLESVVSVAVLLGVCPLISHAQTWSATPTSTTFSAGTNWVGGIAPSAGGNLIFSATGGPSVSFGANYTANSITFSSSYPGYFLGTGNSSVLTIGSGGVSLDNTGTGTPSPGFAQFGSNLGVTLSANQTWTADGNLRVDGNVSGANLTKAGTGFVALTGSNTFSSLTINTGAVYLGQGSSAGSGTLTIGANGTLGTMGSDITLSQSVSVASGATIGGTVDNNGDRASIDLGAVSIAAATTTLNVVDADVFVSGAITGPSSTNLTAFGNGKGLLILGGSQTNISQITASNTGVIFANSAALPGTKIQASNGGYVSVGDIDNGATPSVTTFLGLITDKAGFNGVIGFDTSEQHSANKPTTYSDAIDLSAFATATGSGSGQTGVRLGSQTAAILTGAITPPGQSYDFGGFPAQGGFLVVQSALADHGGTTGITVVSPTTSGGAAQHGLVLALQGSNTYTGNVDVSYSSVIFDSTNALPTGKTFSLGAYSYAGYTEATSFSFSTFAARNTSHTATSIFGIDSSSRISGYLTNTSGSITPVTDTFDLSGMAPVFLGTQAGATISNLSTIKASNDNVLRLVSMTTENAFTINAPLSTANVGSLVVGLPGSEGSVVLNSSSNDYAGGTTLQGGALLVGHTNALGTGAVTVNQSSGDRAVLGAATNGITITNGITVNNGVTLGLAVRDNGNFTVGTNALTVGGVISGSGHVAIEAPATLTAANTYSGGTTIWANTTASNATALGTTGNVVDLGRNATLTLTTSLTIGSLASSSNFDSNAGTGSIDLGSSILTVNQVNPNPTSNYSFTGIISGTGGGLTKNGTGNLQLTGANTYTGATTLTQGTLSVSNITNGSSASGIGASTSSAANLVFNGGALNYTGSNASTDRNFTINNGKTATISVGNGATTLTMSGASTTASTGGLFKNGGGTLVLSGTSDYTGVTTINNGTLSVSTINNGGVAGNLGAASNGSSNLVFAAGGGSATLKYTGATASTNRGFTINTGKIASFDISNGAANLTISGTSGVSTGGVNKTGAGTLTLSGTHSYTGSTFVNAGTLRVDGSIASSAFSVVSGATLGGSGIVGTVSVASGATLAPGSSAGLLSTGNLSLLGTTMMELGGTTRGASGYDAIDVTGNITFGGTLSVVLINSFSPTLGASFNLFDWTGSQSGTFGTFSFDPLGAGLAWDTSALYTTGVITVSAVPEPSTYATIAATMMLGFAIWRRRQLRAS